MAVTIQAQLKDEDPERSRLANQRSIRTLGIVATPPAVNFGFNVRPRPLDFEFSVSFETGNSLPVSNETESFPTSGKNSFPFERRLPGLDIVVGDLLFPRADRFDSEFIEHAEHLCGYAIGHARKRAQAMGGER